MGKPVDGLLFDAPPVTRPVRGVFPSADLVALAQRLPTRVFLGTSSWAFPGWAGLVYDGAYGASVLAQQGLKAYAQHPLLRTVSIDRGYYAPIAAESYAADASSVPADFRFVVKAPALVTDGAQRDARGAVVGVNPTFLDIRTAEAAFVAPAVAGLHRHIGALVFEISPLPASVLRDLDACAAQLEALLCAMPKLETGVFAVEVRDPQWLHCAGFWQALAKSGARYCLALHPRMPPIDVQLRLSAALPPGPFLCRYSLNARFGKHGYSDAKSSYAPFRQLVDPDDNTRQALAAAVVRTTQTQHDSYVTINNKAEGCAPLSVKALAEAIINANA